MPSVIAILLHVGKIIQAVKDIESEVLDLIHKDPAKAAQDAKAILADIQALVSDGLIAIPGISADQINAVIASLESV